jgi:glutathione synthase/RimK-type ligase-like ATP-grasp enzyme
MTSDRSASPAQRRSLLMIGTGHRFYSENVLSSIGSRFRVHQFLGAEPTWEREHIDSWTVVDLTETRDASHFIAAARRIAPVHGVMSWDEARVLQVARVAEALGLPGVPPDRVLGTRDKSLTRTALAAAGVPQPESVLAGSVADALAAADRIGYPVVLKPRAMAASLGVIRVDTPDELAASFTFARDTLIPGAWHYDQVLVEEYLPDPEISVDCAVHEGTVYPMCVAHKEIGYPPYFEETGHVVYGADPLLHDPTLLGVLRDAHAALGFGTGFTHTEIKLTGSGPKIVEVNGRLSGGLIPYLARRAGGVDSALAAAEVACGLPPSTVPDRDLVAAIRFFYPEHEDTRIGQIRIDRAALPSTVDRMEALAGPGDVKSPPPKGTRWGRLAFATAVARTEGECQGALDAAARALTVEAAHARVS